MKQSIILKRILLVIIFTHLLYFIAAMYWGNYFNGDSYEYIYSVQNMKNGWFYAGNPAMTIEPWRYSLRTPGYPFLLYFVYVFFGMHQHWIVFVVQNILSISSCWVVLKLLASYNLIENRWWLYALFVFFYPAQMFFCDMIVPDLFLQFFLVLYLKQLILYFYDKHVNRFWLMAVWLMLAVSIKPVVHYWLYVHLLFVLWQSFQLKRFILLFSGLIPFIFIVAFCCFNLSKTGYYHFTSNQPINLVDWYVKDFQQAKYGYDNGKKINDEMRKIVAAQPTFKQRYLIANQMGKDTIRNHLLSYTLFHLQYSLRYFFEPGKGELDLFTGYNNYASLYSGKSKGLYVYYRQNGIKGAWTYLKNYPLLPFLLLVFVFNVLRVVGFLAFLLDKKQYLLLRVALLIYVFYFAVITGPISTFTRYFLPDLLIMSACATVGLNTVFEKLKYRHLKLLHE